VLLVVGAPCQPRTLAGDAMAIWIVQWVGREIRVLDYIEGIGHPLSYYAHELRKRGWKEAIICLPHDGVATNNIIGKRYVDHWRDAGFECDTPIKNAGAGAATMRIQALPNRAPIISDLLLAPISLRK
jgi:phage terminase large subunit